MTKEIDLNVGKWVSLSVTPTYEIFYKDGYGIYSCLLENKVETVIKGHFSLPLHLQQIYDVEGKVVLRGFDKQIDVSSYRAIEPKGEDKVITYLMQLKGLKKRAESIYEVFGDDSISVLKKDPESIVKSVKGIGIKKAKGWQSELLEMESEEADILYLLNLGLSSKQATQLRDNFGKNIRKMIGENPYILLSVKGSSNYSFLKCDELAKKMDFEFGHPMRMNEGLIHCLKEAGRAGHTFQTKEELFKSMQETLGVSLTINQMRKVLHEGKSKVKIHSRVFNIDLDELAEKVKKIDSLKRISAKEKYRYPLFVIETKHFEQALDELLTQGDITINMNRVALTYYDAAEEQISEDVARLAKTEKFTEAFPLKKELAKYLKEHDIKLEEKQEEAVHEFSKEAGGFFVLNGSAGCGKTFTLKIIIDMLKKVFEANHKRFDLTVLAPTGRASKVATKSTGYEAKTIHRGLEYNPETGFQKNSKEPLSATVLVVDEASMIDVQLAQSLFKATANGTKVILMGDIKQLPSVGAGNVLLDLINSPMVKVITLDVVKRQGELSGAIKNANHIINGEMMQTYDDTKDSYIIHEDDDAMIQRKTVASIKRLLTFPDYTLEDIQVLVPQKRGSIGVYELNALIQATFNPIAETDDKIRNVAADKIQLYFHKGDKVIHTKNNYDKVWYTKTKNDYKKQETTGITNGETGVIEEIRVSTYFEDGKVKNVKQIVVKYEEGYVFYEEGKEVTEIDHAYCLSIHKSQGSQWKAVIIPISSQHSFFLDRNLLYTAWTRLELFGTVIGPKKTLAIAIKKEKSIKRNTQLQEYLTRKAKLQVA